MSFNKLANTVAKNNSPVTEEVEGARGRSPNPEIAKLMATGMPYWKARATVRRAAAGQSVAQEPKALVPRTVDSGTQKTQAAVEDFLSTNPDADLLQVMDHLKHLNPDNLLGTQTGYITNPKVIDGMISAYRDASVTGAPAAPAEPADTELPSADAEKAAKFARLRSFLQMKQPDRQKYLARANPLANPTDDEEEQEAPRGDEAGQEKESDPYVHHYVKAMKPRDDEEEDIPDLADQQD